MNQTTLLKKKKATHTHAKKVNLLSPFPFHVKLYGTILKLFTCVCLVGSNHITFCFFQIVDSQLNKTCFISVSSKSSYINSHAVKHIS